MTNTNPTAAEARENARQDTGRFGKQEHSAPEPTLAGVYSPGQAVYATISFEEYASEHDEHPVHVATQRVDIAGVLDTFSLDDVQGLQDDPWAGGDDIVYTLQQQGALTHGDMPFEFTFDDGALDGYLEDRTSRGLTAPVSDVATPSVENLTAVIAARADNITALQEQLSAAQAEKEQAEEQVLCVLAKTAHPGAAVLAVQLDNPRYPVELYGTDGAWMNVGETAERELADRIRMALGEDSSAVGGRGTARVVTLA